MNNNQLSRMKSCGIQIALILCLFILMLENGFAAVRTPFQGGNYYALVIGNSNYQDKQGEWSPLTNPINDAMAVVEVLKRQYAFSVGNIKLITDANRGDIIQALNDIINKVNPNDSVLVFYAGHGYLNEDTKEAYWIPIDAHGADETNYLSHETVKKKLGIIADRASHVLLVSDSCFSGAILTRGVSLKPKSVTADYFRKKAKRKSVQIVAAGGKEYVDDDYRSTGHSPFTYFFLKELQDNNKQYLAVSEFINNIEKNVANNVKQSPTLGRLYGAGDEDGEFIFTRAQYSEEEIQNEIAELLKTAENFFRQEQYVSPPGNNARLRWQEVLSIDPGSRKARQGLTSIAEHYVAEAKKNIKNKRFDEAENSLETAEGVMPGFPPVKSVRESLKKERDYVPPPVITW